MKLRVACVQLNPVIGSLKENTERALLLVERAFPNKTKNPDLIIFPELSLTGYNFSNKDSIKPFLEKAKTGHSSLFARDISSKYGCYTVIGYPEVEDNIIYNSAIVSSPIGSFIHNYRKSFLYETDETWGCVEGGGFKTFELEFGDRTIKSSIGICMDLNPYKFEAPFYRFEFARHCLVNNVELILCPMLWLQHDSPSIKEWSRSVKDVKATELQKLFNGEIQINFEQDNVRHDMNPLNYKQDLVMAKPDFSTLNYWILRFFPFLNYSNLPQSHFKPTVVVCNRSGLEKDVMYAGSSGIFQFNNSQSNIEYHDSRNDSVEWLGYLGQGVEGVFVRDIEI